MSNFRNHPWILSLVGKLLQGNEATLKLLDGNPFPDGPPKHIRAEWYRYRFSTFQERKETGAWWVRRRLGVYLPPLSLSNANFRKILEQQGWL